MPATDRPKRRFHFYAILLLVAVGMLVGAGALSVWLPYHRKQLAIVEIQKAGGKVQSSPGGPGWLRWGEFEVFDEVTSVDLSQSDVNDDLLEDVSTLTSLRWLMLNGEQISDAGFENLSRLQNLRVLQLHATRVTETRMKLISGFSNLRELSFNNSEVTDGAFRQLRHLPRVDALRFQNTSVTTEGFEQLRGLTRLRHLLLAGSDLSKEDVNRLRSDLPGCSVGYGPRHQVKVVSSVGNRRVWQIILARRSIVGVGPSFRTGTRRFTIKFDHSPVYGASQFVDRPRWGKPRERGSAAGDS